MDIARKPNELDAELEQIIQKQKTSIKVVGCGGAGNNTLNRISEVGTNGAQAIAINTDAQDLLYTNADKKILIGRNTSHGMGAGSVPKIGETAARENEHEIKKSIENSDLVFITCGLGGGTGTGSAPVVAEIARGLGILTIGIVTLPFTMEGTRRYENALYGLERLEKNVDTLIVIRNDKLLELAPDLPIQTAFKVADEILSNAVKGIIELIMVTGLVNLDFADIKTVMQNGGVAVIGVGESDGKNRALDAVHKALENPLLDVDITGSNGALINVVGGSDMTLEEAREIVEAVTTKMDNNARVIWGAMINEDLKSMIRVMIVVTGVKSKNTFVTINQEKTKQKKQEFKNELGIDFL